MPLKSRRFELEDKYQFHCECARCKKEERGGAHKISFSRSHHAGSSMTRSASAEALAGAWSGGGGGGGGQNPVEECRVAGATKRLENALGLVSEPRVVAE